MYSYSWDIREGHRIIQKKEHYLSMADLIAISVETLRIDSGCSLKKEFTELIHINLLMVIIPIYQLG